MLILLDDAQFQKGGWNHRDKIKTAAGTKWLTLPIDKGPLARSIADVRLQHDARGWCDHNLNQLRESYREARWFEPVVAELEARYRAGHARMVDLNFALLDYLMGALDVEPEIVWASQLECPGRSTERLVELVRAVGGSHYLSGTGALDYLDAEPFARAGITLELQRFEHPCYPQLHGEFVPYLSSIDALFNCGPAARALIR